MVFNLGVLHVFHDGSLTSSYVDTIYYKVVALS